MINYPYQLIVTLCSFSLMLCLPFKENRQSFQYATILFLIF